MSPQRRSNVRLKHLHLVGSGGSHCGLLSKDELQEAYGDGVGEGLKKPGDL